MCGGDPRAKESEEKEVTKDIEWLKEEIAEILLTSKKDGTNYFYHRDLKEKIYNAIDQLDEPEVEVTEFDALNRLAENVQFSADEIASHLEKLSAYNGEVTYGKQEALSQKWIKEYTWNHHYVGRPFIYVEDL